MTKDELQKVLDEQSAVSERMHEETGAPLVTVPRPGGSDKPDMQQNKAAERPDGWYWVRWTGPNDVVFDWTVRKWEEGEFQGCMYQPEVVGPRIPSPDEPAPRDAAIIGPHGVGNAAGTTYLARVSEDREAPTWGW